MPLGSKYLLKVNNKGNKASSLDFLVDNKSSTEYNTFYKQNQAKKQTNNSKNAAFVLVALTH